MFLAIQYPVMAHYAEPNRRLRIPLHKWVPALSDDPRLPLHSDPI